MRTYYIVHIGNVLIRLEEALAFFRQLLLFPLGEEEGRRMQEAIRSF